MNDAPMTTREYAKLIGYDPDHFEMMQRIQQLACRPEDLGALVAANRCTCQNGDVR